MAMRQCFKIIGLVIIGSLICGAGCKKQVAQKSAAPPRKQVAVKRTVEAFGVIKAREYKDINLEFPAQITKVPVKDGQHVGRGEALIYLDTSDFEAQLKNKEFELANARYNLLKQQKTLRDAQESYARAKRNLRDKEKLLREGALSSKEVDEYRDVVLEKKKAVTDIRLLTGETVRDNELRVLNEKVKYLEFDLVRMRHKLNQSFLKGNMIVSDFANAVVYDIGCAAGYSVGLGDSSTQKKLLSIMNLDSLYIVADVPEDFIKDVKLEKAVTITPVADNKRKYRGKVVRIADMAVKTNGETNVAVEISIENSDGFLRPNFNVDVEIAK
jgi:HlyD family secretion protein